MSPNEELSRNFGQELNTRYRNALFFVASVAFLTFVLPIISYLFGNRLYRFGYEDYTKYFWAIILVLGISAFVWRRVRFSRQSLRDTLTLRGASGALAYLQTTSILLAILGGLIAVAGFAATILSGDFMDSVRATIVAFIVLFISFPRKNDWQKVSGASKQN